MEHPTQRLKLEAPVLVLATALRVLIGWHLLYEGLVKILDPRWSSGPYLMQSRWLFSDLFHWMAGSPVLLNIIDAINAWGLLLLGASLLVGIFTKPAAFAGAALVLIYYIANPPFTGAEFGFPEGHYLGVNKNLIEVAALCLIGLLPGGALYGLDRLRGTVPAEAPAAPAAAKKVPLSDNRLDFGLKGFTNRREMLKNLTVVPLLGGFVLAALKRHGWRSYEEENLAGVDATSQASVKTVSASTLNDLKSLAPKGTLGELQVSRIICGGNLISGFAHARDLIYVSPLLKAYFHDEKVIETLWLCESAGINTAILRTDQDTIRVLKKYWERGGKMQWIAQTYPKEDDVTSNIDLAIDNGALGAFIQGGIADTFVRSGRMDLMRQSIDRIKSRGVSAGTAAHEIATVKAVEEAGLATDFYMKTLHHLDYWSTRRGDQQDPVVDNKADNYWEMAPEDTIAYMETVGKPWIAYKVLAAGAISPEDGFRYAFQNGADFACVGMFDFQVVDNVNTVTALFSEDWDRSRRWMA